MIELAELSVAFTNTAISDRNREYLRNLPKERRIFTTAFRMTSSFYCFYYGERKVCNMEMSYAQFIKHIYDAHKDETIYEAVNRLKPLGKFIMSCNGQWEPVYYAGYTLITPTFGNDYKNVDSYNMLRNIKKVLLEKLSFSKYVEAPDNALHMTVARLISGETFEKNMIGTGGKDFLNYIKLLFSKLVISGQLRFEITGISVFPQGVIAAMVCPVNEDDYKCLQNLREYIYSDNTIKEFGVVRKRGFNGHITLVYIENELEIEEKEKLAETVLKINESFFARPLPFCLSRAEVRSFNNFSSFDREEDWPFFEFI